MVRSQVNAPPLLPGASASLVSLAVDGRSAPVTPPSPLKYTRGGYSPIFLVLFQVAISIWRMTPPVSSPSPSFVFVAKWRNVRRRKLERGQLRVSSSPGNAHLDDKESNAAGRLEDTFTTRSEKKDKRKKTLALRKTPAVFKPNILLAWTPLMTTEKLNANAQNGGKSLKSDAMSVNNEPRVRAGTRCQRRNSRPEVHPEHHQYQQCFQHLIIVGQKRTRTTEILQ